LLHCHSDPERSGAIELDNTPTHINFLQHSSPPLLENQSPLSLRSATNNPRVETHIVMPRAPSAAALLALLAAASLAASTAAAAADDRPACAATVGVSDQTAGPEA